MRKSIVISIILFFNVIVLFSQKQENGTIKGLIVEKSSQTPLEFTSVSIKNINDTTFFLGTVTDKEGNFIFENLPFGEYKLCYSYIGFETTICAEKITLNTTQSSLDIGKLNIAESYKTLNDLEVVGQKSTFENSIDRKTFNIGQDLMSKASSISDLMQTIPSLQVDVDGNVSLRGSDNVTILVDGKPSSMMKLNSAAALQQIPAGSVEKIEIITNPSAKYKPDGTSGIINIVLKKNKGLGFNGSINANAGNNNRYNITGLANYSVGKINIFGSYGFRQDYRNRINDITTKTFSNSQLLDYSKTYGKANAYLYYNIVKAGIDYKINDKNKIGVSANFNYRFQRQHDSSIYTLQDSLLNTTLNYDRIRYLPEFESDLQLTAYYQLLLDKKGQELNVNYTNSKTTEKEDNYYTNVYQIPTGLLSYDNMFYHHSNMEGEFSVEYSKPFTEHQKFECGYLLENTNNNMNLFRDTLVISSNIWNEDFSRSNQFIRSEYTHVLYATYEQEFKKIVFLLGLRAEQTNTDANLVSKDSLIQSQYFRLYPTLHLTYKLTDTHQFQLNYSHRIHRPEDEQLNPFPEYQDMQNIRVGNPKLKPEDIHSFELGYQYKQKSTTFLSTLYYRSSYNGITTILTNLGNNVFLSSLQNLSLSQSSGLELILSTSIGKLLNLNLSTNTFYNTIDASTLGYSSNKSTVSWSANGSASFNLTKSTTWQVTSNYSAERLTPQGYRLPTFVINSGIKQELLKKKGALTFSVSDIFNTLSNNLILDTPELYRNEIHKRSARVFYVGFTYSFGGTSKKQKGDAIKYDNQM